MNVVRENPQKTLRLFGNVTETVLQKQIATIMRFSEVSKTKSFDYNNPLVQDMRSITFYKL